MYLDIWRYSHGVFLAKLQHLHEVAIYELVVSWVVLGPIYDELNQDGPLA
jgi:hypothetical protein